MKRHSPRQPASGRGSGSAPSPPATAASAPGTSRLASLFRKYGGRRSEAVLELVDLHTGNASSVPSSVLASILRGAGASQAELCGPLVESESSISRDELVRVLQVLDVAGVDPPAAWVRPPSSSEELQAEEPQSGAAIHREEGPLGFGTSAAVADPLPRPVPAAADGVPASSTVLPQAAPPVPPAGGFTDGFAGAEVPPRPRSGEPECSSIKTHQPPPPPHPGQMRSIAVVQTLCAEVATTMAEALAHRLFREFVNPLFVEEMLERDVLQVVYAVAAARDRRYGTKEEEIYEAAVDEWLEEVRVLDGVDLSTTSAKNVVVHRYDYVQPPGLRFGDVGCAEQWREIAEDCAYAQCRRAWDCYTQFAGKSFEEEVGADGGSGKANAGADEGQEREREPLGRAAATPGTNDREAVFSASSADDEEIRELFRRYVPDFYNEKVMRSSTPQIDATNTAQLVVPPPPAAVAPSSASFWRAKLGGVFTRELERLESVWPPRPGGGPVHTDSELQRFRIPRPTFERVLDRGTQISVSCVYGVYKKKCLLPDRQAYADRVEQVAKSCRGGRVKHNTVLRLPETDFAIVALEEELRLRCGLLLKQWAAEAGGGLGQCEDFSPDRGAVAEQGSRGTVREAAGRNDEWSIFNSCRALAKEAERVFNTTSRVGAGEQLRLSSDREERRTPMDQLFVETLLRGGGVPPPSPMEVEGGLGEDENPAEQGENRGAASSCRKNCVARGGVEQQQATGTKAAAATGAGIRSEREQVAAKAPATKEITSAGSSSTSSSQKMKTSSPPPVTAADIFGGDSMILALRRVFELVKGGQERDFLALFDHNVLHDILFLGMHEADACDSVGGEARLLPEFGVLMQQVMEMIDTETVAGLPPLTEPIMRRLLDFLTFGITGAHFEELPWCRLRAGTTSEEGGAAEAGRDGHTATLGAPARGLEEAFRRALRYHQGLEVSNSLPGPGDSGRAPAGFFRPASWVPFFRDGENCLVDCQDAIDRLFQEQSSRPNLAAKFPQLSAFTEQVRFQVRGCFRSLIDVLLKKISVLETLRFTKQIPIGNVFRQLFNEKADPLVAVCDRVTERGGTSHAAVKTKTIPLDSTNMVKIQIARSRLVEIKALPKFREKREEAAVGDSDSGALGGGGASASNFTVAYLQGLVEYSGLFDEEMKLTAQRMATTLRLPSVRQQQSRFVRKYCSSTFGQKGAIPEILNENAILMQLRIGGSFAEELAYLHETSVRLRSFGVHKERVAEILRFYDAALVKLRTVRIGLAHTTNKAHSTSFDFQEEEQEEPAEVRDLIGARFVGKLLPLRGRSSGEDTTSTDTPLLAALRYFCDSDSCRKTSVRVFLQLIACAPATAEGRALQESLSVLVADILTRLPERNASVARLIQHADDREELLEMLAEENDDGSTWSCGCAAASTPAEDGGLYLLTDVPLFGEQAGDFQFPLVRALFRMRAPDAAVRLCFWLRLSWDNATAAEKALLEAADRAPELCAKTELFETARPDATVLRGLFPCRKFSSSSIGVSVTNTNTESTRHRCFLHESVVRAYVIASTGASETTSGRAKPEDEFEDALDAEMFAVAYQLDSTYRRTTAGPRLRNGNYPMTDPISAASREAVAASSRALRWSRCLLQWRLDVTRSGGEHRSRRQETRSAPSNIRIPGRSSPSWTPQSRVKNLELAVSRILHAAALLQLLRGGSTEDEINTVIEEEKDTEDGHVRQLIFELLREISAPVSGLFSTSTAPELSFPEAERRRRNREMLSAAQAGFAAFLAEEARRRAEAEKRRRRPVRPGTEFLEEECHPPGKKLLRLQREKMETERERNVNENESEHDHVLRDTKLKRSFLLAQLGGTRTTTGTSDGASKPLSPEEVFFTLLAAGTNW